MLFHGLPAWAGIGRACQHFRSGNLSRSSVGGQRGGTEGGRRERQRYDGRRREKRHSSKGLCCFWGVTVCLPSNMILSSPSLCSSHGAFAVQICRRRAEETSESEQVPSEREAVAQRRRGKMLHQCRSSPQKVFHSMLVECRTNQCCSIDLIPFRLIDFVSYVR